MIDHKDGGFKSRKMIMAYVVLVMILAGFALAGHWSSLTVIYGEYCTALLAGATIYTGSNALVKWMAAKAGPQNQQPPTPPSQG